MNSPRAWFLPLLALLNLASVPTARAGEDGSKLTEIAPRLSMSVPMILPRRKMIYQRGPAIAFGRDTYLIVWQEGYNGLGGKSDILGLRLDPDGKPIDEAPIAICADAAVQDSPAVAFCGSKFLVVWSDLRNGRDYDIYGSLVSPDGKVEKPNGLLLSGGKGGQGQPALASNGKDGFLAAWQDHRGGQQFEAYGARVSSETGESLDRGGQLLLSPCEAPAVAWTGRNYLVTAGGFGCLVGPDGKPGERLTLWLDGRRDLPAAAASAWGRAFSFYNTVSWPDSWGWGSNGAIIGVSVTAQGAVPERSGVSFARYHLAPNLADGKVKNALDAARWRNQNGWPAGMPGGFKGSHEDSWPSGRVPAAFNGRSMLVVWNRANFVDRLRMGNRDLYLRRVLDGWAPVDAPKLKIVAGKTDERLPALAAGRTGDALLAYEKQLPEGGVAVSPRDDTR